MDAQDVENVRQQPTPERGTFDVSSPLRGVVLCCTSIPADRRTEIATQAEQMGAQHKYDLTSEVTHLIVGEYDTPKYRYVAKERPDVKVLKPDWIEAVRQVWIHDLAIDVKALEREHVWPTFAGLQVCMTGFDDPERQAIADLVQENGGNYHGDLTKQVTHLIAFRPEGAKYKHAKAWGIRLVSLEWLHESVERGMILDEKLYSPEFPQEQRGQGAWTRSRPLKSPLGKRPRDNSIANIEEGRRKLRRTASTKLISQNENIWGDIVGGSGTIQAPNSFLCDAPRQNSDDPKDSDAKPGGGNIFLNRSAKRGSFSGCNFYILGFDHRKSQILKDHLFSHEGHIFDSLEDFIGNRLDRSYVVVPHDISLPNLSRLPKEVLPTQLVTDWWIEQCLESKSFINPSECPFGLPFPKFPIEGFSGHIICSTGFVGMQLRHLSLAATLLGAKYDEMFTPEASVLVCDPRRSVRIEKLQSAKDWKIPMVSIDWLLESIEVGKWLAFGQYILGKGMAEKEHSIPLEKRTSIVLESGASNFEKDFTASNRSSTIPHDSHQLKKAPTLDASAFDEDSPATLKEEESFTRQASKPAATSISEPLSEISTNSPQKRASKANAIPAEEITNAISSLLAKSKSTLPHPVEVDLGKKRAPPRILGRAASNVSTGSRSLSRASSVDSTASYGNAVIRPSKAPPPELKNVMDMTEPGTAEADSQPPPTQRLQYEDEESKEYKAQVMARMTGEKLQSRERERSITVGSVADLAGLGRNRNTRSLRDRGSVGGLR